MGFERLRVVNFRNLRDQELPLGAREVFLIGENGQGKSNLIEAIHLLCLGASFREKRDAALVRVSSQETALCGWYASADAGERQLALRIAPGRKRELRVNDKPVSDRRELLAEALCICFVQQDRDFVAGSPEDRRRFFDQTLVLSDLSFLDTLREYRSILKSRNLCLRENRDDLLDVYDEQLAARGLALIALREDLARQFDAVFFPLLTEITGGSQTVRIRYRPSWEALRGTDEVVARLAASRALDRKLGVTTSGPHRDTFSFVLAGREYAPIASTGQVRLCALALRIAQARFLAERTRRKPVLLFDDALLELDPARKRAFLSRFPVYEQAFFTFLPDEGFLAYRTPQTLMLTVKAGDFYR